MTNEASERVEAIKQRRAAWDASGSSLSENHGIEDFIANAPDDIDFLLATVEQQEAEIGRLKFALHSDQVDFERIAKGLGTSYCCGAETMKLVQVAERMGAEVTRLTERCAGLETQLAEATALVEKIANMVDHPDLRRERQGRPQTHEEIVSAIKGTQDDNDHLTEVACDHEGTIKGLRAALAAKDAATAMKSAILEKVREKRSEIGLLRDNCLRDKVMLLESIVAEIEKVDGN